MFYKNFCTTTSFARINICNFEGGILPPYLRAPPIFLGRETPRGVLRDLVGYHIPSFRSLEFLQKSGGWGSMIILTHKLRFPTQCG